MGNISEHFNRSEHECECGCGFNAVDKELNEVLEDLHEDFSALYRNQYKISIEITGPNRCYGRNEIVQKIANPDYISGSSKSTHTLGIAVDFKIWLIWHKKQVDPDLVSAYLEKKYPNKYGIGKYNNRTHLDVREKKGRWDKRSKK